MKGKFGEQLLALTSRSNIRENVWSESSKVWS